MDKVLDQLVQPHQEKKHELFRETFFIETLKRDFCAKFEMKKVLSEKYRRKGRIGRVENAAEPIRKAKHRCKWSCCRGGGGCNFYYEEKMYQAIA